MPKKSDKKKKTRKLKSSRRPLSPKKKALFYGITFSIPVLFFLALELTLRSVNYKGNTGLFIDPGITLDEYLIPNPNFASRYFFYTKTVPNPASDVFLKNKPENGYRVFAMGGSSAAGYPYGYNVMYSRLVKDVLQDAMPEKQVEVINVGISAISSYTLFDQVDEIIEQKPDAVIFYAGHNEFYGALGVGSNENLGAFPGFVRFYLKIQRFKTFMFLRSLIVDSGKWISSLFSEPEYDATATLMERIIDSRSIELYSPEYEMAMHQFRSNLGAIIAKYEEAGIPFYIGSVASNLKDHPPFISISDGEQPPAQAVFDEAKEAFDNQDMVTALEKFTHAKDLDGLKFRAPSEINEIIRTAAEEHPGVNYVPVEEALTAYASDGIIGFDLMLEHLHPNQQGYFIIGKSFSESLLQDLGLIQTGQSANLDAYKDRMYLSEYDQRIAWHRVRTLRQDFPFVMGNKPPKYQVNYDPMDFADSLAFNTVHADKRWDEAKVELAQHYERTGQFDKALLEYHGLIRNQPWNDSPYVFAARIYLNRNDFSSARPLLEGAYKINPNEAFTTKMLGAIEVQEGNPKRGIQLLEESRSLNPNDPQMLYNLSGAYGTDNQFQKALEIAEEVIRISPNYPGIQGWIQQLNNAIQNTR